MGHSRRIGQNLDVGFRVLCGVLGAAGAAFAVFVGSVLVRFGSPDALPEVALRSFVSLVLAAVGLWVGFSKPELRMTRSAALGLFLTGVLWLRNSIPDPIHLLTGTDAVLFYLFDVAYPLHLVFGLRFFVEFPPGAPPSRALDRTRAVNDVVGVALLVVAKIVELRPFAHFGGLGPLDWIYANRSFYTGSALAAMLVALVRNYGKAPDADARRRVRWIVAGAVVALGPDMLARFAKALGHPLPIELFTVVAVAALPATFAYAVVQHRVVDIQVVVHRSLSYLLARNVLRLVAALPALALVVDVLLDPNRTVRQLFFDSWPRLALLGLAALALRYDAALRRLVDRLFLREALSADEVLERLLARLRAVDSADDVHAAIAQELEAAFHPRSFAFLRDEALPDELRARVAKADEPVEHAGALAVPVRSGGDGLSGVIVVGRKASGQAWAPGDRRLLGVIGAQVGYALEARALRERVVHEQRTARAALARLNPLQECPRCGLCLSGPAETCPEDGSPLELGLPVEQTIDGKYRLERRIGRGGMGAVYRALDLGLGRAVAVKILVGGKVADAATLRRFEREGRAMARLEHPGIIAVHDFGRIGADGAYLAMELLEGRTLRDAIDAPGRPPPPEVATWFGAIFDAVGAAHRAGVIHRDLKPENVFLTRAGAVKVLDFGLARFLAPGEHSSVTVPGLLMGTLGYIAPEQFLGKEADVQSDVFSLAVMLFETLTGELPFPGRTIAELATSVFVDEPHLPGATPEVRALDGALGRCLVADRRRRIATVAEMARTVLPALEACPALGAEAPTATPRRAEHA
jgi:hypothetical protein